MARKRFALVFARPAVVTYFEINLMRNRLANGDWHKEQCYPAGKDRGVFIWATRLKRSLESSAVFLKAGGVIRIINPTTRLEEASSFIFEIGACDRLITFGSARHPARNIASAFASSRLSSSLLRLVRSPETRERADKLTILDFDTISARQSR